MKERLAGPSTVGHFLADRERTTEAEKDLLATLHLSYFTHPFLFTYPTQSADVWVVTPWLGSVASDTRPDTEDLPSEFR